MKGYTSVFTAITIISFLANFGAGGRLLDCPREQTAFVNTDTLIECTITAEIYGVYWYRGESKDSLVRFVNHQKAGPDFRKGKLDIIPQNGSMIIKNVSAGDEGLYRVMVVLLAGGDVSEYVSLTVIIPSTTNIPTIDHCNCKACCICVSGRTSLLCQIDGRPAVTVAWYSASSGQLMDDQRYTSELNMSSLTFHSYSSLEVDLQFQEIVDIICVPSGIAINNPLNRSIMLITPSDPYLSQQFHYFHVTEDSVSLPLNHNLNIINASVVAVIKQTMDAHFSERSPTCIHVGCNANESVNIFHEDNENILYTYVVKKNAIYERYLYPLFRANLLQSSIFPLISNCTDRENCTMHSNTSIEHLKCSVKNTRPAAVIKWEVDHQQISIISVRSVTSCGFNLCNSSNTITFHLHNESSTLKCSISGPWAHNDLSSYITVIKKEPPPKVTEEYPSTESTSTSNSNRFSSTESSMTLGFAACGSPSLGMVITLIMVSILLVISVSVNAILIGKRRNPSGSQGQCDVPTAIYSPVAGKVTD